MSAQTRKVLPCPVCRTAHRYTSQTFFQLPKNYNLVKLLDLVQTVGGGEGGAASRAAELHKRRATAASGGTATATAEPILCPTTRPVATHSTTHPRQIEYDVQHRDRLVYATLTGELVVLDMKKYREIGRVFVGTAADIADCALGLSFLNHSPSKMVVGLARAGYACLTWIGSSIKV